MARRDQTRLRGGGEHARTLTRAGIATGVASDLGLPRVEANSLVESVLRYICAPLSAGEPVKITGFGSFLVKETPPRMARNPKTGEPHPVLHLRRLKFIPSRRLMAKLQQEG